MDKTAVTIPVTSLTTMIFTIRVPTDATITSIDACRKLKTPAPTSWMATTSLVRPVTGTFRVVTSRRGSIDLARKTQRTANGRG